MRRRQSNQEHKLPKSKSIKTQLYTEREASPTATCSLHQQWRICHSFFKPNYRSCISVAAGNPRRPAPISGGNRNAYTVVPYIHKRMDGPCKPWTSQLPGVNDSLAERIVSSLMIISFYCFIGQMGPLG